MSVSGRAVSVVVFVVALCSFIAGVDTTVAQPASEFVPVTDAVLQNRVRLLAQETGASFIVGSVGVELDRTRLIQPTAGSGSRTPHGRIAERMVNWSHPAYANGHIVHRNDREIIRASLRTLDY